MNTNKNTLELFHACMKNQPEEKRKTFSKQIRRNVQPLLSCLDNKEVPYKIVGSVAREIAHKRSDFDLHVDIKDKSKALQCARFTRKKSQTDTCGLFEQYSTRRNNTMVDMSFYTCQGTAASKWDLFPHLDDDMRNIMFCTSQVLRRNGLKMATHDDYHLNPTISFNDVHAKRKLYSGTR